MAPEASVFDAVSAMAAKSYGSVIVTSADKGRSSGSSTERDVMNKLVAKGLDAATNADLRDHDQQPETGA